MEESPSFSSLTTKIITINIKTNHPLKIAALAFKPVTKNEKKKKSKPGYSNLQNNPNLFPIIILYLCIYYLCIAGLGMASENHFNRNPINNFGIRKFIELERTQDHLLLINF